MNFLLMFIRDDNDDDDDHSDAMITLKPSSTPKQLLCDEDYDDCSTLTTPKQQHKISIPTTIVSSNSSMFPTSSPFRRTFKLPSKSTSQSSKASNSRINNKPEVIVYPVGKPNLQWTGSSVKGYEKPVVGDIENEDKSRTTGFYSRNMDVINYYPTDKDSFKMNLTLMVGIIAAVLLLVFIVIWTLASRCRRQTKERVAALTARDKAEAKNLERKLLGEVKSMSKPYEKYKNASDGEGTYKSLHRQDDAQQRFSQHLNYQSTLDHRIVYNTPNQILPDLFPNQTSIHPSPSQRSKDVKEWYV